MIAANSIRVSQRVILRPPVGQQTPFYHIYELESGGNSGNGEKRILHPLRMILSSLSFLNLDGRHDSAISSVLTIRLVISTRNVIPQIYT